VASSAEPTLHPFKVTFRQVEGLRDFNDPNAPMQLILGELMIPSYRTDPDQAYVSAVRTAGERKVQEHRERDLAAQAISAPILPAGVYCRVAGRQGNAVWRTFDRKRHGTLAGKWLYVFEASDEAGERASLIHELGFGDQDEFRRVPTGVMGGRSLPRRAEGKPTASLTLHRERFDGATLGPAFHFFYLAPFQLPQEAIELVKGDLTGRAVRLWDEFHTDVYEGDDPGAAVPLLRHVGFPGSPPPVEKKLSALVHLVDPLAEARRRAERYEQGLDRQEAAEKQLAADPRHRLAMRLHHFTLGNPGLREQVAQLDAYLEQREHVTIRALSDLDERAFDVIRWIGHEERRVPVGWVDPVGRMQWSYGEVENWEPIGVCERKGSADLGPRGLGRDPMHYRPLGGSRGAPRTRREVPWANPFCSAVYDYWWPGVGRSSPLAEAQEGVAETIGLAHGRLDETLGGMGWLRRNFSRVLGEPGRLVDGGVTFLFGGEPALEGASGKPNLDARKPALKPEKIAHATYTKGAALVLAAYARFWGLGFKEQALSSFASWVSARYGRDTINVLTHQDMADVRDQERARFKAARKQVKAGTAAGRRTKLEKLDLRPDWADRLSMSVEVGNAFNFAFKLVDTYDKVGKVADGEGGDWAAGDLVKLLLEDYEGLSKYAGLPKAELTLLQRKIGPIAILTGAYDVLKGLTEIGRQKDDGLRWGYLISTVGAGTSLALLFVGGPLVGAVLGAVALGIQVAGDWVKDNFSEVARYLRHCTFASQQGLTLGAKQWVERQPLAKAPRWYPAGLAALAGDIQGQLDALTALQFDFEPSVVAVAEGGGSVWAYLRVKPHYPSQLAPAMEWSVGARLKPFGAAGSPEKPLARVIPDSRSSDKELLFRLFQIARPEVASPGTPPSCGDGYFEVDVQLTVFHSAKPIAYLLKQRGARLPSA
jgi:hypothetical protein